MVINEKCWLCGTKVKQVLDHLKKVIAFHSFNYTQINTQIWIQNSADFQKHFLSDQEATATIQNFFMCAEAEVQLNNKLSGAGQDAKLVPSIRLTISSPSKPASRKNSASVLDRVSKVKRVRFDDRSIAMRKYSTN